MAESAKKIGFVSSIREIIFGLEDSLVSTLGAVTGIAAGAGSTYIVILSGLVLIAVESISMSAGSYLSSKAAEDLEELDGNRMRARAERPLRSAFVMLFAYVVGGMVPLTPYLLLPVQSAAVPSIILTVVTLFSIGAWKGKITKQSWWKSGIEMTSVSLAAALLGYLIGRLVANLAGVSVDI